VRVHHLADDACRVRAHRHDACDRRPPDVQVAVAQPHLLVDLDPVVDRERRGVGGREHLQPRRGDLDITGGKAVVGHPLRAEPHHAVDTDDVLAANVVRGLQRLVSLGIGHHLDDAGAVAQIQECHPTVIAAARHPSGEHDCGTVVTRPQRSCAVGPHCSVGGHR
jgi:hypothetical protein